MEDAKDHGLGGIWSGGRAHAGHVERGAVVVGSGVVLGSMWHAEGAVGRMLEGLLLEEGGFAVARVPEGVMVALVARVFFVFLGVGRWRRGPGNENVRR